MLSCLHSEPVRFSTMILESHFVSRHEKQTYINTINQYELAPLQVHSAMFSQHPPERLISNTAKLVFL